MLRTRHDLFRPDRPPSSPIRRLVFAHNAESDEDGDSVLDDTQHQGAEFVSSAPAPQDGSRIRRTAFQPNYFKSFFKEERELGRGGKGVVLLVRHEIDGCHLGFFACKRVPVGDDHGWLEKVLLEVELLAKLSHPNLVSYRHVWLEDVQLSRFSPTVACAFILQQYCNSGDLWKKVVGRVPEEATKEELKAQMRRRSKGQLDRPVNLWSAQSQLLPEEIYSYFRDITAGLAYLHAANYIHRDLKPNNCLLHDERGKMTCLISDFGEVQAENVARKSTGSTGTISYCAPEVLRQDASGRYGNFTTKSDIFSLGMILYFMCFGRLPYQAANTIHEELEDIDLLRAEITDWKGFEDERRERPELPGKLYTLLKQLLALNPNDRPSANEVLTALKNATIESMSRGAAPGLGVPGRRIQNLDSPNPPSTPVPGRSPLILDTRLIVVLTVLARRPEETRNCSLGVTRRFRKSPQGRFLAAADDLQQPAKDADANDTQAPHPRVVALPQPRQPVPLAVSQSPACEPHPIASQRGHGARATHASPDDLVGLGTAPMLLARAKPERADPALLPLLSLCSEDGCSGSRVLAGQLQHGRRRRPGRRGGGGPVLASRDVDVGTLTAFASSLCHCVPEEGGALSGRA